jgi:predicted nucleic acid-binding protein
MPERLVVDANVAVKWFLRDAGERDIRRADEVLLSALAGEVELHAPRIFTYEVCGALTKACAHRLTGSMTPRLSSQFAASAIHELFRLPIKIQDATEYEAVEAMTLATLYAKGHYDMTYLRLAQQLDCQWCTADEKFVRAVPEKFPLQRVLILSSR